MLLQLLASRKQLPLTLLPTPEANASQRAWHLDIATLLQLVLNQLLIAHWFLLVGVASLASKQEHL